MGQDHTLLHIPQKKARVRVAKGKKIRVVGEIFIINLNAWLHHMALTISCIGFPDVSRSTTPLQGTQIQDQFQFPFSAVSLAKIHSQYKTLSSTTMPSFLPRDVLTPRDEHFTCLNDDSVLLTSESQPTQFLAQVTLPAYYISTKP